MRIKKGCSLSGTAHINIAFNFAYPSSSTCCAKSSAKLLQRKQAAETAQYALREEAQIQRTYCGDTDHECV